jgi:NAD(P)-dependent dehydrogenase (short-subunit alcohol dehydrogenase family)
VTLEGRKAFYFKCDVADDIALKEFVDQSFQFFGKINILISNAGRNVFKGAEECSLEDWDYNIRLNYRSHWLISKYCKPYLDMSDKAFILIMSSNHAYSTIPGSFPYNTTKAGLTGMVNALATEWGPHIRVVGLAPGFIETEGGESWFQQFDDPQAEKLKTIRRHPAGKLGTIEEVGAFCAFLASDYAGFITGVTYLMDGGRSSIMQDE